MTKWSLPLVFLAISSVTLVSAQDKPTTKLLVKDIKVGKGPKAGTGDLVVVRYTGKLTSGKTFDSNASKDKPPFGLVLGAGEVIQGWDKGLVGIQLGTKRHLVIPPVMGYGANGSGEIPANATLVFDVECIDMVKKADMTYYDKTDLKVGKGKVAKKGSNVTINYIGTLSGGSVFDSTYNRKAPVQFVVGSNQVMKSFSMGIEGMREGGKRKLRIPPAIAFGEGGFGGKVPRNAIVYFEIELVKVK